MFSHIYRYRLKTLLREKEELFWSLLFPILLAICFALALSAIADKAYTFHSIPVAVVFEKENELFHSVLEETAKNASQGEPFFIITETDSETAASMLDKKQVDAVITVSDEITMTVKQEGINQTAISGFLSEYLKKSRIISETISSTTDPETIKNLSEAMAVSVNYLTVENLVDEKMDSMATYYFSLIAMTALFGSFLGLSCSRQMQANITVVGLRKNITPVKRGKMILAEFLATYTVHLFMMLILLLFMQFILRIHLGTQFGYIALVCAIGSLFGIASGMFIGSLPRLKESGQVSILVGYSLLSSFFSGLMAGNIQIFFAHHVPLLNRINPATLISDALYSLQVYSSHTRYFQNLTVLAAEAVILVVLSYLFTRRKSYANL